MNTQILTVERSVLFWRKASLPGELTPVFLCLETTILLKILFPLFLFSFPLSLFFLFSFHVHLLFSRDPLCLFASLTLHDKPKIQGNSFKKKKKARLRGVSFTALPMPGFFPAESVAPAGVESTHFLFQTWILIALLGMTGVSTRQDSLSGTVHNSGPGPALSAVALSIRQTSMDFLKATWMGLIPPKEKALCWASG